MSCDAGGGGRACVDWLSVARGPWESRVALVPEQMCDVRVKVGAVVCLWASRRGLMVVKAWAAQHVRNRAGRLSR